MQDEIIKVFVDWIESYPNSKEALLPQNLQQNHIDILLADTENMIQEAQLQRPKASRYITAVTLLFKAQIEGSHSIKIKPDELSLSISRLTHAIYLENMRRRDLIKNLKPEFSLENIFDRTIQFEFELTDLGKRMVKNTIEPFPTYH